MCEMDLNTNLLDGTVWFSQPPQQQFDSHLPGFDQGLANGCQIDMFGNVNVVESDDRNILWCM
jgi:hypothetical protein